MARLSNEQINQMSINEAIDYSHIHPAESGRVSKNLLSAGAETGKIAIKYTVGGVMPRNPSSIIIDMNN